MRRAREVGAQCHAPVRSRDRRRAPWPRSPSRPALPRGRAATRRAAAAARGGLRPAGRARAARRAAAVHGARSRPRPARLHGGRAAAPPRESVRPALQRVDVMPTSQPKPAASGNDSVPRALCVSARWPDSGSRGSKPVRSANERRAPPLWRSRSRRRAALGERRHGEIGARSEQRRERSPHVRVTQEQQAPAGASRLRERERLPLAAPRQAHDACARLLRRRRPSVARAVVGDDHDGAWAARGAARRSSLRSGLSSSRAAMRIVGAALTARPGTAGAATGSIGGRMPSVAVCFRP